MNTYISTSFWEKAAIRAMEWVIHSAPTILVILLLTFVLHRASNLFLNRLRHFLLSRHAQDHGASAVDADKRMNTLISIVKNLIRFALWLMASILLLRELGVDIAPIIAGAGILGLAVGFGAQNLVKDFISGFFLILENHIRVGDEVTINGQSGIVESVGLRNVLLRDSAGAVHIFANGQINQLSNNSKGWSAALFTIVIDYEQDVEIALNEMRQIARQLESDETYAPFISQELELFGVDKFTEHGVVIKARIKTVPMKENEVAREYNRRLKQAFDKSKIKFAQSYKKIS